MKNYDRYKKYSESSYNKKGLSYYLMRKGADRILFPYLKQMKNKTILEVGIGYGYYTKVLVKNKNIVMGADVNPQLFNSGKKPEHVRVVESAADQIKENIDGKFDRVLSFFMTEYLSLPELESFISQGVGLLDQKGVFGTTIILNKGIGKLYTVMAGMKGIKKYSYSTKIIEGLGRKYGTSVRVIPLKSVMNIPFAVFLEIRV